MDSRDPHAMKVGSSEPPGMMMGSYSYSQGVPAEPNPPGAVHLQFGSVSKPAEAYNGDGGQGMRSGGGFGIGEQMKKKRGRPRKYGPDGNLASPLSGSVYGESRPSQPSAKRRGRPPGSGKKQMLEALGPSGSDFIPHIITINPGENVASKIMAFSQQGPRTVCILSASGFISNVALRQPATCGGTVTYEGRFEILSLSGSYMLTEDGDTRSRTGGLSVTLGGSDGRVLGGGVAGVLTAASPVQVIVGSFLAEVKKPKFNPTASDPSSVPQQMASFGGSPAGSTHSHGSASGSFENDDEDDEAGSPFNRRDGAYNDSGQQHIMNAPPYTTFTWSHPLNQQRQ